MGARAGRDAADAAGQRPARPDHRPGRRPDEDRPRRDHRRAAGRRGVRLRHRSAGRRRLRDDARLPPRHLPGRRRHAEPRAAGAVLRQARVRRDLLRVHRAGGPRAARRAGLPHDRGGHRPDGRHQHPQGDRPLEGQRARPVAGPRGGRAAGRRRAPPDPRAGPRPAARARQRADRAGTHGDRRRRARVLRRAGPQRQPHGRHHARQRGHAGQPARPAGRVDHGPAARLGRAVPRGLPPRRRDPPALRRRQRLRRQGPLGRPRGRATGGAEWATTAAST